MKLSFIADSVRWDFYKNFLARTEIFIFLVRFILGVSALLTKSLMFVV